MVAAPRICSKLSSTNSAWQEPRCSITPATRSSPPVSGTPSACPIAAGTRPGSRSDASGMKMTPSGKLPLTSAATRSAKRLLPTPQRQDPVASLFPANQGRWWHGEQRPGKHTRRTYGHKTCFGIAVVRRVLLQQDNCRERHIFRQQIEPSVASH